MSDRSSGSESRYWLMTGDVPLGPFDAAQIHIRLAAGQATLQTLACPVGGSTWLPLIQLPAFGPPSGSLSSSLPVSAPTPLRPTPVLVPSVAPSAIASPIAVPATGAGAWNPVLIAWLGLPFTPMWAGVMAALNGKRLGMSVSGWLPILIGFGYLATDIVIGLVVESYLLSLLLYCGAAWVLWAAVLKHQSDFYSARPDATRSGASWGWPTLAGIPMAGLVFLGFVVEPLRPLEPREVCERFNKANTVEEAKKHATLNLWPAIAVLCQASSPSEPPTHYELTGDEPAPREIGGHLVGMRTVMHEAGQHYRTEGLFHLVQRDNEWKIEELYLTSLNGQPLDTWIVVSKDYVLLGDKSSTSPGLMASASQRTAAGGPTSQQKQWYENKTAQYAAARGVAHGLSTGWLKAIGAFCLACVVAAFRFGKDWLAMLNSGSPGSPS